MHNADKYLLQAVGTGCGVFGLLRVPWVEAHAVLPVTRLQGVVAASMFNTPAAPISVTLACSGTEVVAMCVGAVLAYPVRWSARLRGAGAILLLILGLNTVRIGTLGLVATDPLWFDALHLYLWPSFLTITAAAAVYAWMRHADGTNGVVIAPSWRFAALALVLLILSTLSAPLYLESAGVRVFRGVIATAASMVLTTFGATAHATGDTLWTSRGGFTVTGDCVATPLLPLYVAAVWVYASTWSGRVLGTLAAGPVFLILGVLRLLLVAVPQTMAAPEFATHAFYQVVTGIIAVIVAGRWQHQAGNRTAPTVAALGVGVLGGVLLVGWYTSLVLWPVDRAFPDPQGAVTFLPAFQLSLWLALVVAAVREVPRRTLLVITAVLISSHVGLAWGLTLPGVPALLAANVALVRAWAVAVPVLMCAAVVVAHARARE